VSDSAPPNLQYYRFGAAESDTEHRWMHTESYHHSISTFKIYYKSVEVPHMYAEMPQCQIRRRRICSTTASLDAYESYHHSISTFKIYYKSVEVPHMYAEMPQCQIRRRRICSTTDSALPNLTLSIAGCIQGLTIIQYQLLTSIISQ
jgi:hypothetical protein